MKRLALIWTASAALVVVTAAGFEARSQQPQQEQAQPQQPNEPTAANRESAPQPPIIVNVLPTPKTEDERADEARERKEKSELDRRLVELTAELSHYTGGLFQATVGLVLATVFLVIVTAGLLYFAFRQSRDTKESILLAATSVDISKMSLVSTQRAWVFLESFSAQRLIAPDTGNVFAWSITAIWNNVGQTPTINVGVGTSWRIFDPGEEIIFEYPDPPDLGAAIGPKIGMRGETLTFSTDDVMRAFRGEMRLFLFVYVSYNDVFQDTPRRHTRYCAEVRFSTDPSEPVRRPEDASRHSFIFSVYAKYNSAD